MAKQKDSIHLVHCTYLSERHETRPVVQGPVLLLFWSKKLSGADTHTVGLTLLHQTPVVALHNGTPPKQMITVELAACSSV